MPHRDPRTGKFVEGAGLDDFDDIIQVQGDTSFTVAAADVGGQTGETLGQEGNFEGAEMYDVEEFIDRFELAALLWVRHRIDVYIASTQTADGTIRGVLEFSTSPSKSDAANQIGPTETVDDTTGDFNVAADNLPGPNTDSNDLIGPVLSAIGHGPITDGTNGVGGAGTPGKDIWEGPIMVEPVLDDRDTVFVNGVIGHSNVSDASLHMDVHYQHVLGLLES